MIKFLTFYLILSSLAFAQANKPATKALAKAKDDIGFKMPSLKPGQLPIEFELVYNTTANNLKRKQYEDFLKLNHKLAENFKTIRRENLFFLLKAEVYRSLIEFEFDFYIQKIDINPTTLSKIAQKIKLAGSKYQDMAKWLFKALYNDFEPYMQNPLFINLGRTSTNLKAQDQKLLAEIKRKIAYLAKWIYVYDKKKPKELNSILSKVSWKILSHIESYSRVLSFYTKQLHDETSVDYFVLAPLPKGVDKSKLSSFENERDTSKLNEIEKEAMKEGELAQEIINNLESTPTNPINPNDPAAQNPVAGLPPVAGQMTQGQTGELVYDPNTGYFLDPITGQYFEPPPEPVYQYEQNQIVGPGVGQMYEGDQGGLQWVPQEYGVDPTQQAQPQQQDIYQQRGPIYIDPPKNQNSTEDDEDF